MTVGAPLARGQQLGDVQLHLGALDPAPGCTRPPPPGRSRWRWRGCARPHSDPHVHGLPMTLLLHSIAESLALRLTRLMPSCGRDPCSGTVSRVPAPVAQRQRRWSQTPSERCGFESHPGHPCRRLAATCEPCLTSDLTTVAVPRASDAACRCGERRTTASRSRRSGDGAAHYRRRGPPRGRAAPTHRCPRCADATLDRSAYAELLGCYLGDGCTVPSRRGVLQPPRLQRHPVLPASSHDVDELDADGPPRHDACSRSPLPG